MSEPGNEHRSKRQWRSVLRERRAAVPIQQRERAARALHDHLTRSRLLRRAHTVCAYVPVGDEPGSRELLDTLAGHARVLLPIVDESGLDWAEYRGPADLASSSYGLDEPIGDRLGAGAIATAEAVLVPALAVDHVGTRLGRGAGYYDRALRLATAEAALIAIIRDEELVTHLPADPHDVPVTWAATPERGLLPLG